MDRYPELNYKDAGVREQVLPLARSTAARLSERMDTGGELVEADGIALLFLACLCEDKIDAGLENTCHRVFAKSPFSTMLTSDPKLKSTTVKLYSRWTQYTSNKRGRAPALFGLGIGRCQTSGEVRFADKRCGTRGSR